MDSIITKSNSWKMFNEISPRYDLLNRLLSLGLDIRWRNQLAKYLFDGGAHNCIDLATGTGDVLLSFFDKKTCIRSAIGIDLAEKMLSIGREKIEKRGLSKNIILKHGDANKIPEKDNVFDNATMSFGIRNTVEPVIVLKEINRVLNPGGRALILEFSIPKNPLLKLGHLFYLRTVVPFVGGLVSGNAKAYKYLNSTIETFPCGNEFCQLMKDSGFVNVKANALMGGIATIYQGDKE